MKTLEEAKEVVKTILENETERSLKFPYYLDKEYYVVGGRTYTHRERSEYLFKLGDENEYCWLFYYDCRIFIETKNSDYACVGNVPLIVDKETLQVYISGLDWPKIRIVDFADFKKGLRTEYDWHSSKRKENLIT